MNALRLRNNSILRSTAETPSNLDIDNRVTGKIEYKWDLDHILGDKSIDDLIEDYFTRLREVVKLYSENNIFQSKVQLLFFHKLSDNVAKLGNKIFAYLNNKYNEDLTQTDYFEKAQKLKCDVVVFYKKLSEFDTKAVEHEEEIRIYLRDPDFQFMTRFYEELFRNSKYKLPDHINKYMISYSPVYHSYERIFATLRDQNMLVGPIKNKEKKFIRINNYEQFMSTQYSEDRVLRKNAFLGWHDAVRRLEDTFSQLLYFKLLEQNIHAKNCGFEGGFYESAIFRDELTDSFIPYLYKKVARFSVEKKRYEKTRKQMLKRVYRLNGIKPWDLRMPIIKDSELNDISIEEAKEFALEALSIFGEEYKANVQRAFKERWIDWEIRTNKTTGAYSIGDCSGVEKKYILMNYNYKLDSVYTLVHELGHSMHSLEFGKHQHIYDDTSIFIAEIPSTVNEIVLSFYLLEKFKGHPKKQLQIYDYLIDNFFSSTVNQVILSDWEFSMNSLVNNGRVLSADLAKVVYKNKQIQYQGNRITKPLAAWKDISLVNVLTVPHFYSGDFYVYKYAVGAIVGILVYLRIKEDPSYLDKYFEFLRSGSSKSNLETLKILGIDLERTSVWSLVKATLAEWCSEYEKLAKQVE